MSCLYLNFGETVLTWTHFFPSFIFLGLWVGTLRIDGKKELFIWSYSWWLTAWVWALWGFQVYFARLRPHEMCGHIYTYAFPSQEAFLVGSLVAAFFTYAYIKGIHLSWISWFIMYSFTFVLPIILIVTGLNVWWEVLVSFALGIASSVFIVSSLLTYLKPYLPYLAIQRPFTWFHLADSYCWDSEEFEECTHRLELLLAHSS